ncbi:hypothetical protein [Parenemella sanctibonifatiensis]|uniref:Uncharacterized protein n=1 Tax=Parenemella sanctibonifatiensis TaxID=2016505 RepID=A0A255E170_9ACTN|nr:hypothetical protein [Parenemella sanctibonifatiensis]OYN85309.1 hypothetical protein CGZ92_10935 [Parenemella sanctibonifatiensis]
MSHQSAPGRSRGFTIAVVAVVIIVLGVGAGIVLTSVTNRNEGTDPPPSASAPPTTGTGGATTAPSPAPTTEPSPTSGGTQTATVPPPSTPAQTQGPDASVRLPPSGDLEWQAPGDWLAAGQDGNPALPSRCVQRSLTSQPGILDLARQNYTLAADERSTAVATVMIFETEEQAEQAAQQLRAWSTSCLNQLVASGNTNVRQHGNHQVSVEGGEAGFTEFSYLPPGAGQDDAVFASHGVIQVGTSVAYLVMEVRTPEAHWRYTEQPDETGLESHPMIRTLPKIAGRIQA